MSKRNIVVGTFGSVVLSASIAWAQEHGAAAAAQVAQPQSVNYFIWSVVVAGLGLAIAAAACGIAQSIAIARSVEGIARQPEAAPKIQLAMMSGLAFIESLVLYILFIGIILLFVNPFAKYFVQ
jgi:F-type H+-transporting ATPase subunit c